MFGNGAQIGMIGMMPAIHMMTGLLKVIRKVTRKDHQMGNTVFFAAGLGATLRCALDLRTAAGVFLEVRDVTGRQALSSELLTLGTTGLSGHSSTFSKTDFVLPVQPGAPYVIRVGVYVATPDDGKCDKEYGANMSVTATSLTLEDYTL